MLTEHVQWYLQISEVVNGSKTVTNQAVPFTKVFSFESIWTIFKASELLLTCHMAVQV